MAQSYLLLSGRDINYMVTDSRRIILRIDLDTIEIDMDSRDEVRVWGLEKNLSSYVSIVNYYETGDRYLEQAGFRLLLHVKGINKKKFKVMGTYKQILVNTYLNE